ncbi:DUF4974 domain-containing protein [Fulvivirga sp. 29W222]|uniref:DUF4974 domain-containing protein n=1 Tax=Fulvivirga marina TaxID=2494733 RepID=A0A937G189_9BACT|nr:FecR family protein [Fulvivirga marina]MBL6448692.1 DUF4974 domain-containing protein [Fulvivirga marina]
MMEQEQRLIKKYLAGNCTKEEQKAAMKILRRPEPSLLDEVAEEVWNELSTDEEPTIDSEALYKSIEDELGIGNPKTKTSSSLPWLYAACISFLAISAFFFFQQQSINNTPVQELIVKSMPAGQKSTIILSDGSKIILNSGSKISYPKTFTDTTRTITLEGEAFFDVVKDKTRPFSVIANGLRTTALGTSFNINARGSICRVALATGKVIINNQNDTSKDLNTPHILAPGEALEVDSSSKTKRKFTFDPQSELLWKDGVLYFKNTSLEDITKRLELWYDVEFDFKGKTGLQKKYTGRFENASLKHVLDNISYAMNFEYFIQGKKITIINQP